MVLFFSVSNLWVQEKCQNLLVNLLSQFHFHIAANFLMFPIEAPF